MSMTAAPSFRLLAAAVLALEAGASCRQIVGIESGRAAADGAKDGGAPDGGELVGGLPISGKTPACAPCLMLKCLDEAAACAITDGCAQLEACVESCAAGDIPCREVCGVWNDDTPAVTSLNAFGACRAKWCDSECLPGPWDCLGHVTWSQPPAPAALKFSATAYDEAQVGVPLDADVRVCDPGDPACATPLLEFPTSQGSALLPIDSNPKEYPFQGYLDFRAPGYLTELIDLGAPVVTDSVTSTSLRPGDEWNRVLAHAHDPTRAILQVVVADCSGGAATSGDVVIRFADADPQTVIEMAPSDALAAALVSDLPISVKNKAVIQVSLESTGQTIGSANVPVRPDTVTLVVIWPRP